MLEIANEGRYKLKAKSIILSKSRINDLLNNMSVELNSHTIDSLKKTVSLSTSIFSVSHFIETFKGETINFANYYLFHRTINFAKRYLSMKDDAYILHTIEKEEKMILQIEFEGIIILKIDFTNSNIKFELMKIQESYEELLFFFAKELSENPSKKTQQRLQKIIKLGNRVEEINKFFVDYVKNIGLDVTHTTSWYSTKIKSLKDF